MTLFERLTLGLAVLTIVGFSVQLYFAERAVREDHARQRRQATLEYIVSTMDHHWGDALHNITDKFGDRKIDATTLSELRADREMNAAAKHLLGGLEHMALGVNLGVYDFEVVNRASGAYLMRLFFRFHAYIDGAQKTQSTSYCELENLIKAILCARQLPPLLPYVEPPLNPTGTIASTPGPKEVLI